MKKITMRGKLFSRFLISYLLVVLVPLSIIGSFYVSHFYKAFQSEVLTNINKDLANISTRIDTELAIFRNTVSQIGISRQFLSLSTEFNTQDVNDAKSMLANFSATNSFVSDVFLVAPEMGYILNSSSSNKLSYFTERYYQIEGISPQVLTDYLNCTTPTIMPVHSITQFMYPAEETLLFNYPVYSDYARQKGNVVFQVAFDNIKKMFDDKLLGYNATSFLLNSKSQPLAQVNSNDELTKWARALPEKADDLEAHLQAVQTQYFICRFTSMETGFTCISLIPRSQASFAKITQLNFLFLLSLLAASAVSVIAIFYAMRFNYLPLRKLQDKAGKLSNKQRSQDEIQDIESALDLLSGRSTYLQGRLDTTAVSVKSARLQKLLADGYSSVQDFNLDCQELDMHFDSENLLVTTTFISNKQTNLDDLAQRIKLYLCKTLQTFYLKSIDNQKLVLVHALPTQYSVDDLAAEYARLHKHFFEEECVLLTTGIGTVIKETIDASQSYLNASVALDYRFVKGNGQVIRFNEIGLNTNYTYPQQSFEKLKNALQTNTPTRIDACITEIIERVRTSNYPLATARGICFDIINLVTNRSSEGTVSQPFIQVNLFALSEFETIHDIVSSLTKWQQELLAQTTLRRPAKQRAADIQEVLAYLRLHCLNCEFSLSETAEFFGMTLPKFSQFFKDAMNQDALSYIIGLRMQKAAQILTEKTDESIERIAQQTGYYNTSSFIRRFKQSYGVTPNEYRKSHTGA